jgi:hypothetical protein
MTATPVTPATRPAPRPVPESIATGRLTLSRERRGPGTVVALLIHAAIVAFVLWQSAEILGEGGGGPGARGGGGGRGRMRAVFFTAPAYAVPQVELPTPPAVTVPVMAVPAIPLDLARIDIPQPQTKATATGPATGVGPGTGGGQGAGQGPGVGSAVGPGTGGEAGYILQASPRWLIIPPGNAPSSAKGHALRVQFWVAADGRVTRVNADPEIGDAGYRRAFMERMMGYLFNPATTRDGQPVASVYVITVTP